MQEATVQITDTADLKPVDIKKICLGQRFDVFIQYCSLHHIQVSLRHHEKEISIVEQGFYKQR